MLTPPTTPDDQRTKHRGHAAPLHHGYASVTAQEVIIAARTLSFQAKSSGPEDTSSALAQVTNRILTVDIPDPKHPGTAAATTAALKQKEARLHFVSPFVRNGISDTISGFGYENELDSQGLPIIDPTTGRAKKIVTKIYADSPGAAHRALAEAHRLGYAVSESLMDPQNASPMADEQKNFFKSQQFQEALTRFHKTIDNQGAAVSAPQTPKTTTRIAQATPVPCPAGMMNGPTPPNPKDFC